MPGAEVMCAAVAFNKTRAPAAWRRPWIQMESAAGIGSGHSIAVRFNRDRHGLARELLLQQFRMFAAGDEQ